MSMDDEIEDMLVLEGGELGIKDKDKFMPIMNFSFTIQHFVGDEQMGKDRRGGGVNTILHVQELLTHYVNWDICC